jgi:hypothetical protein
MRVVGHRLQNQVVRRIITGAMSVVLAISMSLPAIAMACEGGSEEGSGSIADSGNINYGKVVPPATAEGTVTFEDDFFGFPAELGTATMKAEEGNGFSIKSDGCSGKTLKTGETCKIKVLFSPLFAAKYKSTLALPWSAAGGLYKGEPESVQTGEG